MPSLLSKLKLLLLLLPLQKLHVRRKSEEKRREGNKLSSSSKDRRLLDNKLFESSKDRRPSDNKLFWSSKDSKPFLSSRDSKLCSSNNSNSNLPLSLLSSGMETFTRSNLKCPDSSRRSTALATKLTDYTSHYDFLTINVNELIELKIFSET